MLARHHQGTQKIVISDNIFVTEKKAHWWGNFPWRESFNTVKICLQRDDRSPFPPFNGFGGGMSFRDFSVTSHHRLLHLEVLKWKCIQIRNGIIVVSFLGVVPAVHVYVVSTLPDKPSPYFLCAQLWPVTEKAGSRTGMITDTSIFIVALRLFFPWELMDPCLSISVHVDHTLQISLQERGEEFSSNEDNSNTIRVKVLYK